MLIINKGLNIVSSSVPSWNRTKSKNTAKFVSISGMIFILQYLNEYIIQQIWETCLGMWYVNVCYFISRMAKLDPSFEMRFDGKSASSDLDGNNSRGKPWCDRSSLPLREHPYYTVYKSCLYELLIYCIKCGNQRSSIFMKEFGYTGNHLTYRFTCVYEILIFF